MPLRVARVFLVVLPVGRVGGDVFLDAGDVGIIADDVFVIVALPDGTCPGVDIAARGIGDSGFEGAYDGGDGRGHGSAELFHVLLIVGCGDEIRVADAVAPNNAVDMVGHDDELIFIQGYVRAKLRGLEPFAADDMRQGGWDEFSIHDLSKEMNTIEGNDGDVVGARLGVIVTRETDGTAVAGCGHGHGWVVD